MRTIKPVFKRKVTLPLFGTAVRAGFPSPADDHLERSLDLNEYLIQRPSATFLARAAGMSMINEGIGDGDILIVDRSVEARQGSIVIAAINGELTCKILDIRRRLLLSAHPDFPPIHITDELDTVIEGVVTWSIRKHYI
jgi:DNA polymerase V